MIGCFNLYSLSNQNESADTTKKKVISNPLFGSDDDDDYNDWLTKK